MRIDAKKIAEWKQRFGAAGEMCPECKRGLFAPEPVTDPLLGKAERVACSCGFAQVRRLTELERADAISALLEEREEILTLLREIGLREIVQSKVCPVCGPVEPLGHTRNCRLAPFLQ